MVLFGGRPTAQEIVGGVATIIGVVVVTGSRAGMLTGRHWWPGARRGRRSVT
jgi:hypothetical protein